MAQITRRVWIRTVRAWQDMDQHQFADAINIARSTLANYERGTPVPDHVIEAVRTTFDWVPPLPETEKGLTNVHLLEESEDSYERIPYAGVIPRSGDWSDPMKSAKRVPVPKKFAGPRRWAATVGDDSWAPYLKSGDTAIFEADPQPPTGSIVCIEKRDGKRCDLCVRGYAEGGGTVYEAVNPQGEKPEGLGWTMIARLVGIVANSEGPEWELFFSKGLRRHFIDRA